MEAFIITKNMITSFPFFPFKLFAKCIIELIK